MTLSIKLLLLLAAWALLLNVTLTDLRKADAYSRTEVQVNCGQPCMPVSLVFGVSGNVGGLVDWGVHLHLAERIVLAFESRHLYVPAGYRAKRIVGDQL